VCALGVCCDHQPANSHVDGPQICVFAPSAAIVNLANSLQAQGPHKYDFLCDNVNELNFENSELTKECHELLLARDC